MVNTGKPSGGCKLCRARRIKCDEGKPSCMRCIRSKRQCPGYRDPFDAKIRDETQMTIKKCVGGGNASGVPFGSVGVRGSSRSIKRRSKGDTSSSSSSPISPRSATSTSAEVGWYSSDRANAYEAIESFMNDFTARLSLPVEQQATCFFMADFVLIPKTEQGRGWHRFVYSLMRRQRVLLCLDAAFKAVSYAALARRPNCRHLQVQAQTMYAKALKEVQLAIEDPVKMKDDQTLAAVLLLAFYESVSCSRARLDEYVSHMKGASHLIKIRGEKQRQTPEGHEMFALTRNQMLSLRQLPGSSVRDDFDWLLHHDCRQKHVGVLAQLGLDCANVQQQTDRLARSPRRDSKTAAMLVALLRRAQELSAKLKRFNQPPSAEWAVDTEESWSSSLGSTAFPGPVFKFGNLYAGLIYLSAWTSHLFLTTCIFRLMAALVGKDEYKQGAEYAETVEAAKQRVEDIVSSVPYFLNWKGKDMVMSSFPCGSVDDHGPIKGSIGMNVQWPIYVASVSDFATADQRAYLRGRLKYLANVGQIKQAESLLAMEHMDTPSSVIEQDQTFWGSPSTTSSVLWTDTVSPTSVSSFSSC